MRNVFLIIACSIMVLGCALCPDPATAQIVQITNIEIRMLKTSTRPPLRIMSDARNPNDFAVRDIEVDCTIKDKAGNDLVTYTSIIYGVLQPNQRTTTRGLNIGAWPAQGYAALCVSKRGMRVTPASAPPQTPSPPAAPGAQANSPAPAAPTPPAAARQ